MTVLFSYLHHIDHTNSYVSLFNLEFTKANKLDETSVDSARSIGF